MSRFRKLAQTIWYCQYHIVWVPKYRFRILTDKVAEEVENCIRAFIEQQGCEVMELNVQAASTERFTPWETTCNGISISSKNGANPNYPSIGGAPNLIE